MADLATSVQWEHAGLLALAEDDGHGDTCGPIIMLDYLHVLNGQVLDYNATNALRTRLIADKLMASDGTGMTMGNVVTAMQQYYGVETLKYVPWNNANGGGAVLAKLKTDLVAAMEAHQFVAMETHNAAALPGNQAGIGNHFILSAGYNSATGLFYVCNGDLLSVLAGGKSNPAQQPVWVSWENLVKAQISSYAIWPAVEVQMLQFSQVSRYFSQNSDGSWQYAGHAVRGGILDFYRSFPWGSLNGLSAFGLPKSSEVALGEPASGKTAQPSIQIFERAVLVYDPDRAIDNPPGATQSIYLWHIDKPEVLAVIAPTAATTTPFPIGSTPQSDPTASANPTTQDAMAVLAQLLRRCWRNCPRWVGWVGAGSFGYDAVGIGPGDASWYRVGHELCWSAAWWRAGRSGVGQPGQHDF